MSDERPSAAYCRQAAAEVGALAEQAQSPEVSQELRELAERFCRIAERRDEEPGFD